MISERRRAAVQVQRPSTASESAGSVIRSHLGLRTQLGLLVVQMPCRRLSGLFAGCPSASGPENTGEENGDKDGHDDKWGSDVHGGRFLSSRLAKEFCRLNMPGKRPLTADPPGLRDIDSIPGKSNIL